MITMMMTATLRHTDRPRDPRVIYLATWLLWRHHARQALRLGLLVRQVFLLIALWAALAARGLSR
jgi:hypothetical protein